MSDQFTLEVREVVCLVVIDSYTPGDPGRTSGPPEDCWPPEPPEVEWHLEDAAGVRLEALEADLDDEEMEAIDTACFEFVDKAAVEDVGYEPDPDWYEDSRYE